jgi:hypothetical protein
MNAIELIETVRSFNVELVLEEDKLVLRGSGERLPEELRDQLVEHKAELLIALGAPMDRTIAGILDEIRPHLPVALSRLPDSKLLALVNWSLIHAWGKAVAGVTA